MFDLFSDRKSLFLYISSTIIPVCSLNCLAFLPAVLKFKNVKQTTNKHSFYIFKTRP